MAAWRSMMGWMCLLARQQLQEGDEGGDIRVLPVLMIPRWLQAAISPISQTPNTRHYEYRYSTATQLLTTQLLSYIAGLARIFGENRMS